MTCDVIRDLLPLCADGVASEESRSAVEAHIETCSECRALYEAMHAPVEVQETSKEPDYMEAVRRQKKANRRFILRLYGITLGVILLLVLIWQGKAIFRNRVWTIRETSLTAEQVAGEMPQALLTRAEKDLAKEIFSMPEVQEAFREGSAKEAGIYLSEELYRELLTQIGVDPDSVKHGYADILGRAVILDYYNDEYRCILEFIDSDQTGHADVLRKGTTARVPQEGIQIEIPHDVPIYTAEINAALIRTSDTDITETDELSEELVTTYEKMVQKRDWLYFLKEEWQED